MFYTHGAPILGVMPVKTMFSVGCRTPSPYEACALQDVTALHHQFSSVTLSKPTHRQSHAVARRSLAFQSSFTFLNLSGLMCKVGILLVSGTGLGDPTRNHT